MDSRNMKQKTEPGSVCAPIEIDQWKRQNRRQTRLALYPIILTRLSRQEKQALLLKALFSDETSDQRLNRLVQALVECGDRSDRRTVPNGAGRPDENIE